MPRVLFFDLEINRKSHKIEKIGAVLAGAILSEISVIKFYDFAKPAGIVCGHNIIDFDLPELKKSGIDPAFFDKKIIDTLYLSALLFSEKPYHKLVKNYKLIDENDEENNPVSDAKLSRKLLIDEYNSFNSLDNRLKSIYYSLLKNRTGFSGFFEISGFSTELKNPEKEIKSYFNGKMPKTT